jgi:D-alanyl-D-alanine carboxypeptidase
MRNSVFVISLVCIFSACANNSETSGDSFLTPSNQKQDSTIKNAPSKNILTGKFNPAETEGFVKVPDEMATKPMYIQQDAFNAFVKMRDAAAKEKVNLFIVSGTRTFNDQKAIWERKWKALYTEKSDSIDVAKDILRFSSMPGTSRHHWGTDMDLVSVDPIYFDNEVGKKTYDWLVLHAGEYGFCQVYSNKEQFSRAGYSEEKWHWSYMPLSSEYLKAYLNQVSYSDHLGFIGDRLSARLNIKEEFVKGIDTRCLN